MTREIPFIARMIIIEDTVLTENTQKKEPHEDISYNNPRYDSECEYCQNTAAWD